jgi:hypothetical protein
MKIHLTNAQFAHVRALVGENYGRERWVQLSKRGRLKIIRRVLDEFKNSPQFARLLAQYPAQSDGWTPTMTESDDDTMLTDLAELVVELSRWGVVGNELGLMDKLYELYSRMNWKRTPSTRTPSEVNSSPSPALHPRDASLR